jgi:hypothetical protein
MYTRLDDIFDRFAVKEEKKPLLVAVHYVCGQENYCVEYNPESREVVYTFLGSTERLSRHMTPENVAYFVKSGYWQVA